MAKPVPEEHEDSRPDGVDGAASAPEAVACIGSDAAGQQLPGVPEGGAVLAEQAGSAEGRPDPSADGSISAALDNALVEVFDADDSDALFRGLSARLRRLAQATPDTSAGLVRVVRQLQRFVRDGFTEAEAFEALCEDNAKPGNDEALPVLAMLAARALIEPLLGRSLLVVPVPLARQLVGSTVLTARRLAEARGRRALKALLAQAARIGQKASQRGVPARALAPALARAALQGRGRSVVVELAPRVSRHAACSYEPSSHEPSHPEPTLPEPAPGSPAARHLRLTGPVEIVIYQR